MKELFKKKRMMENVDHVKSVHGRPARHLAFVDYNKDSTVRQYKIVTDFSQQQPKLSLSWRFLAAAFFLIGSSYLAGCKSNEEVVPDPVIPVDDKPAIDISKPSITIDWEETATKISHDVPYAEYGRVHRINGDTLLLTYHCGDLANYWDNVAMRRSVDGGVTWSAAEIMVADNDVNYWGFANPELLVLKNGWLLLAYTGRGKPDDNAHDNIQVRISTNRGKTFGTPIIVASGRSWEPAMIQMEDGEIELFYSSEAAWWPGTVVQQEILLSQSANNGTSWSAPKHVAYTSGMRDGMPSPLLLKDNKGIVFAIESVNNSKSPWIVWSSIDARWNYAQAGTVTNERRWLATTEQVWGGGPYLVQLPTGETLLSFQDGTGRSTSDWKKNTMIVMAGNSMAQNFNSVAMPWKNLPVTEGAYYSSLFLKDASTVVLITTRNFADNHSEIYWKQGHIAR